MAGITMCLATKYKINVRKQGLLTKTRLKQTPGLVGTKQGSRDQRPGGKMRRQGTKQGAKQGTIPENKTELIMGQKLKQYTN